MISKPVIVRGGEYKCRIFEMHLKLRDQQLKTIMYVCVYVCVYIYIYTHTHIYIQCVYIYICTHTHYYIQISW